VTGVRPSPECPPGVSVPPSGGLGGDRRSCRDVGAVGEIFGVYRRVLTEGFPPMALSESAVSELLEVLRTGDAVDLIRESVRMVLQELIETEASDVIGVARNERTDSRVNERNGSRPRILAPQGGDIDLRIPKLRTRSFFPLILEPRRRIDQAMYAVVMEAYVAGVSTRAGR
jgi:putative transposase